ncbi:MAG: type IX secretion system protein PorQ [Bacteroidaceae bacterium]|nr:type IX secretion system protein PorQ [Bacteroidaceae bacterium]
MEKRIFFSQKAPRTPAGSADCSASGHSELRRSARRTLVGIASRCIFGAVCAVCLVGFPTHISGQESTSVFNFLNLPVSSHSTALGGRNISLIEDDITLAAQNPALLSGVSDRTMGLNFMSYMKGCKAGSAAYTQIAGERGTWGAHAQFVGYGLMKETLATGEVVGDMHALDMCLSGMYSYALSDRWVGGATGKFIYSHYGEFTSCALAVDLGLNYFLEEDDFSLSAAARNLGGQVKAFGDHHERLPFDLEVGFTKGLAHAPVAISLTMADLTRWRKNDFYHNGRSMSSGRMLMNHLCLGVDLHPSRLFYLAAGYNFRRAYEMKAAGSSHAAGLSFGAGLQLKHTKVGLAYAKYHLSAPTFSLSLAYTINKKKQ